MLLDRISRFLLAGIAFEKQIDEGLDKKLASGAPERVVLENSLTEIFEGLTTKWTPERTSGIVNTVLMWNNEPSYPIKIKSMFQEKGLAEPSKKTLQNRHSLAHEGELKSVGASEYFTSITLSVTGLVLKTLGYSGNYFILGIGEQTV